MIQAHELRREIDEYLDGNRTLRDLSVWLAAAGWELREEVPRSAILNAVQTFTLHIAEYTSNGIDRERLNARLRESMAEIPNTETAWSAIEETDRSSTLARTEFAEAVA